MGQNRSFSPDQAALSSEVDRLLSALRDRYRYSALGALVKGIIHNLNGSLQILSMQLELLQGLLAKEGEKVSASLPMKTKQCLDQADKLKGMIEVLLQKGIHEDQDTPQPVDLNDLLEEELSVLNHDLFFKHQIELKKRLASRLPTFRGYYVDLSQSLLNLIHNGLEAMEKSPQKELSIMTESSDREIHVRIADTGCGISEEIRPRLFSPFFTTKGRGHYGLGLYMARELLSPYGASFDFTSGEGKTVVSVRFPLATTNLYL
jgi:signal transduction histidine kinase